MNPQDTQIQVLNQPNVVVSYSQEQIKVLTDTVAKGATKTELDFFLAVCRRTGIDPFTKQVYFIKRKVWNNERKAHDEVATIQTGIDGYRAIASRSKEHMGTDDVVYDTETEQHPKKASVTVYRLIKGERVHFTASARWDEYCQRNKDGNPIGKWKDMPYLMLGKCAEALALRKAFPFELSGLYTKEEMDQSENESQPLSEIQEPVSEVAPVSKSVQRRKAVQKSEVIEVQPAAHSPVGDAGVDEYTVPQVGPTEDQAKRYFEVLNKNGSKADSVVAWIKAKEGKDFYDLTVDVAEKYLVALEQKLEKDKLAKVEEKMPQKSTKMTSESMKLAWKDMAENVTKQEDVEIVLASIGDMGGSDEDLEEAKVRMAKALNIPYV